MISRSRIARRVPERGACVAGATVDRPQFAIDAYSTARVEITALSGPNRLRHAGINPTMPNRRRNFFSNLAHTDGAVRGAS